MPNKADVLESECDRFLTSYDPSSLPRVTERAMKPILGALQELMKERKIPGAEIHAFLVASSSEVQAVSMQHIYVNDEGKFITVLSSVPLQTQAGNVFVWVRPPRERTIEDLIEIGISPYQVVEFIKRLGDSVAVGGMINMPPAQA